MVTEQRKLSELSDREQQLTPIYGRNAMDRPVPKYEWPGSELAPDVAYNLIHDELMLDGKRPPKPGDVRDDLDGTAG